QQDDHEVSHGPAEPHDPSRASGSSRAASRDDDASHGHGHGPWHGPHESPASMTYPLMALAVGAIVAGFIGIPAALGGGNTIEKFLEPSFTASHEEARGSTSSPRAEGAAATAAGANTARPELVEGRAEEHES